MLGRQRHKKKQKKTKLLDRRRWKKIKLEHSSGYVQGRLASLGTVDMAEGAPRAVK